LSGWNPINYTERFISARMAKHIHVVYCLNKLITNNINNICSDLVLTSQYRLIRIIQNITRIKKRVKYEQNNKKRIINSMIVINNDNDNRLSNNKL